MTDKLKQFQEIEARLKAIELDISNIKESLRHGFNMFD